MNKKSLILNSIVAVLSLLLVILTLVPSLGSLSLFTYCVPLIQAGEDGIVWGLSTLFAFIFNIVVLVFSILSILTACNVIKNAKAVKAFRTVEVVFASLATFFALMIVAYLGMLGRINLLVPFAVIAVVMLVLVAVDYHDVKKNTNAESDVQA